MQVCQFIYTPNEGWACDGEALDSADLLLAFGSDLPATGATLTAWHKSEYPSAHLVGCSTAGEICDTQVLTDNIVVTAIKFASTHVQLNSVAFDDNADSLHIGQQLAQGLPHENLRLCFVLSDGLHVNGTRLVDGLTATLPNDTLITGGLAGDGDRFAHTLVCVNDKIASHQALVVGFYGDALQVSAGSMGGWSTFGATRRVTRSEGNVLYELDGQSALKLYKEYLGEYADKLPGMGLRFPLQITTESGFSFVRTLLAIDESQGSMTFAGDVPEGTIAKLMRSNIDKLVDGAQGAAQHAQAATSQQSELAILVSCVGRKHVMSQRVEEELEVVKEELGDATKLCGYYSYGEICPLPDSKQNVLHNQTMTITTLSERRD